jgi:hypothetical protein
VISVLKTIVIQNNVRPSFSKRICSSRKKMVACDCVGGVVYFGTIYFRGACSMMYYGLSLNSGNLVGDIFINFLVTGLIEYPALGFALVAINPLGRKKPYTFAMLLGGSSCLASIFVAMYGNKSKWSPHLMSLVPTTMFGRDSGPIVNIGDPNGDQRRGSLIGATSSQT